MAVYKAPLKDIQFVMNEVLDVSSLSKLPGYEDATPDTIEAILEEAAKICENVLFPINRSGGFFDKYRNVVLTGVSLCEEFPLPLADGNQLWLRHRVIKLGDGVAITTSDASEIKASEARYQSLSNFSNSVFETAPFSIIETDVNGIIQAMNGAAERLTGYKRADLIGSASITNSYESPPRALR